MKNVVGAALAAVLTAVLALGAAAQVEDGNEDGGFGEADAATLGVETTDLDVYCAADAGTLGHPNPLAACE